MIDSAELKKLFIELLERDTEFRYAILGLLGLDRFEKTLASILEEIKKLWEEIKALRENQEKLWLEVKALRESQDRLWEENRKIWEEIKVLREECRKLWEEVKSLRENQEKLWLEVKALRENQERLWGEIKRIWEEIKALRESQEKLWLENQKLWQEVKALREGQEKLWEEVKSLRENQEKLWREVKELKVSQNQLRSDIDKLWRYVKQGFDGLRQALGMSFEEYIASFIAFMLSEQGFEDARVVIRRYLLYEGRVVEINLFCEDPLVVGEATLVLRDVSEAKKEVEKLLERIEIVSKVYGRKPYMSILAIGNAPEEVIEYLREATSRHGIKLIIGREIKEFF